MNKQKYKTAFSSTMSDIIERVLKSKKMHPPFWAVYYHSTQA